MSDFLDLLEPFKPRVVAIVPALNEEDAIDRVVSSLSLEVDSVIVADNGSTDATAERASNAGAAVVSASRRGYGSACIAGMRRAEADPFGPPDVFLFADGDASDDLARTHDLTSPITRGDADLVVGSRAAGNAERGALTITQRLGNALACTLLRLIFKARYTDLGPFRAIRADASTMLQMDDPDFGWTVQMQARAARAGLRHVEVPVDYFKRIGVSKISGTLRGAALAGATILRTLYAERVWSPKSPVRVLIFVKLPTPGHTKTRLIPELGAEGAARAQHAMTLRTLRQAASRPHEVMVASLPGMGSSDSLATARRLYGAARTYLPQADGDLGERLRTAFDDAFHAGTERVIALGSDCPAMQSSDLRDAEAALTEADAVIGPATDGGYWLLGLTRSLHPHLPSLFNDMPWSTDRVSAETIRRLARVGAQPVTLRTLSDVDEPGDLHLCQHLVPASVADD